MSTRIHGMDLRPDDAAATAAPTDPARAFYIANAEASADFSHTGLPSLRREQFVTEAVSSAKQLYGRIHSSWESDSPNFGTPASPYFEIERWGQRPSRQGLRNMRAGDTNAIGETRVLATVALAVAQKTGDCSPKVSAVEFATAGISLRLGSLLAVDTLLRQFSRPSARDKTRVTGTDMLAQTDWTAARARDLQPDVIASLASEPLVAQLIATDSFAFRQLVLRTPGNTRVNIEKFFANNLRVRGECFSEVVARREQVERSVQDRQAKTAARHIAKR